MRTDQPQTETNWTSLKGTVLSGGYELEDFLEGEPFAASFKVRVLGDRFLQAVARFFQIDGENSNRQLAIWESARLLQHPNLLAPLGAGQIEGPSGPLVYLVVSRADESLAGVLPERTLTGEEAGEILTSAVRGLTEIHSQGFVHGCISPEQVLAIGELVKLPTDCIRPAGEAPAVAVRDSRYLAPESTGQNVTAAADVWCLGATLLEALTQRSASQVSRDEVEKLPSPFQHVLRECLNPDPARRCSLNDALAIYRGELKPQVPVVQPAPVRKDELLPMSARAVEATTASTTANTVAETTAMSESVAVQPAVAMPLPLEPLAGPAPIASTEPEPQALPTLRRVTQTRSEGGEDKPPRSNWMIWVVLVAAVLLIIWAIGARGPRPTQTSSVANQRSVQPSGGNSWETRTLSPDGIAAKSPAASRPDASAAGPSKPARAASETHQTPTVNGQVWRLILFTYSRSGDADMKVKNEKAQHPDLGFEVFSPSGHGGPYLVVAGGRMTREEAIQLRRKAISLGLPHDAYIQNYRK